MAEVYEIQLKHLRDRVSALEGIIDTHRTMISALITKSEAKTEVNATFNRTEPLSVSSCAALVEWPSVSDLIKVCLDNKSPRLVGVEASKVYEAIRAYGEGRYLAGRRDALRGETT